MNTPHPQHTHIADTILSKITAEHKPLFMRFMERTIKRNTHGTNPLTYPHLLGQPVQICWHDALAVATEWEPPDTTYQPEPTISIGYLWETTPTHQTLITIINTTHTANGIVIPNGCITNITPLTPQP